VLYVCQSGNKNHCLAVLSYAGVCSSAQAILAKLNEFIESYGFDWMKYKAVATNGTAAISCQFFQIV